MAVKISGIRQVAITVQDVKRATGFYRDKLGLNFLFDAGSFAFVDCGGVRLMLGLPEPDGMIYSSIVYFQVADIAVAHKELASSGVGFINAPHMIARMSDHELWLAEFRDSEGNAMALVSEVRPAQK